jgi:hypothetical protein
MPVKWDSTTCGIAAFSRKSRCIGLRGRDHRRGGLILIDQRGCRSSSRAVGTTRSTWRIALTGPFVSSCPVATSASARARQCADGHGVTCVERALGCRNLFDPDAHAAVQDALHA